MCEGSPPGSRYTKKLIRLFTRGRHFFTERFLEPSEWFERRLAYTHSVATNSMVGYVVGLGDRHPNVRLCLLFKGPLRVVVWDPIRSLTWCHAALPPTHSLSLSPTNQNILINKETAELVHIDLGLAFDQVGRTP